jgi:hypothetical protein
MLPVVLTDGDGAFVVRVGRDYSKVGKKLLPVLMTKVWQGQYSTGLGVRCTVYISSKGKAHNHGAGWMG